jgi:hypothetical protein
MSDTIRVRVKVGTEENGDQQAFSQHGWAAWAYAEDSATHEPVTGGIAGIPLEAETEEQAKAEAADKIAAKGLEVTGVYGKDEAVRG